MCKAKTKTNGYPILSIVAVGASLTSLILIKASSSKELKGVVPPFVLVFTLVPAVPVVSSHARKVKVPVPGLESGEKKWVAVGTNLNLSVLLSNKEFVALVAVPAST